MKKKAMCLLCAIMIMVGVFSACGKDETPQETMAQPTSTEETFVSLKGSYWKAVEFVGEDASDEFWADLFLWDDGSGYLRVSQASAESGYWGMRDVSDCRWDFQDKTLVLTKPDSPSTVICVGTLERECLTLTYEGFLSFTIIMEQAKMPPYCAQWEVPELYGAWRMISYTDAENGYHSLNEADMDVVSEITIHQVAGVDFRLKNHDYIETENELWYTYKDIPMWDGCANEAWHIKLSGNSDPRQHFTVTYADGRLLLKKADQQNPDKWPFSFTAEYIYVEYGYDWWDDLIEIANPEGLEYDELIDLYRDITRYYAGNAEDASVDITYNIAYKLNIIDDEQQLYELGCSIFEMTSDDNFGYAIRDINGDGIPELFILSEDYYNIYAIYTLRESKPVLVGAYWSRNRISIGKDGTLYNSGSSGAANSFDAIYSLNTWQDGEILIVIEVIGIEDFDDEAMEALPEPRYYRIRNGEKTIISEAKADAAWKNFRNAYSDDSRDAGLVFINISG